MGNAIPTRQRELVKARSMGRCERCGSVGSEVHHRQRRREGGHEIENLVLLCSYDHRWAHANPSEARKAGYIVPTWITNAEIGAQPIESYLGMVLLSDEYKTYKKEEKR